MLRQRRLKESERTAEKVALCRAFKLALKKRDEDKKRLNERINGETFKKSEKTAALVTDHDPSNNSKNELKEKTSDESHVVKAAEKSVKNSDNTLDLKNNQKKTGKKRRSKKKIKSI